MFWIWAVGAIALVVLALVILTRRTMCWGATQEERAAPLPGDVFLDGRGRVVAMTRAVSIHAPPEVVWPWLAQCGRGAGWYSVDRLDNGGRPSARHIVSWIPAPRLGDATAVGYLRRLEEGVGLTWWIPGLRFLGAPSRLVVDMHLASDGTGSRLVVRSSADAVGRLARPALWVFCLIDGVMGCRQLRGIQERAEARGRGSSAPGEPESGARDQYQLYEVIYASGVRAGVRGKEQAERWRRTALDAGALVAEDDTLWRPQPGAADPRARAEGAAASE